MEHLNESFLGVEEGITNAIKKLGLHAMGIDETAVRHEALDELAMALQCLKTGEEEAREDIRTTLGDVGTTDGSHGHHDRNIPNPSPKEGAAEKQPEGPSGGDLQTAKNGLHNADAQPKTAGDGVIGGDLETGKPVVPYKSFETLEELTQFIVKMTETVNGVAHNEACRKAREDARTFHERQDLKRSLLCKGESLVNESLLEEAIEALEDALERMPGVIEPADDDGLTELIVKAYARVRVAWRCGITRDEEPDIDVSDNGADGAPMAENSLNSQEGAAQ